MRRIALALAVVLFACGPREAPPEPAPAAVNPTWFICDSLDAPRIYVFSREGETAHVAEYDKPNGAIIERMDFALGEIEGAAGSFETQLLRDGADAGLIRQTNPSMLETPGAAYTPRVTLLRLNGEDVHCRWMPRTRVLTITGRRAIVVHEDADGDLIYTSYDFASAAGAPTIDLSENGVTTSFSLEIRGGEEMVDPQGATYGFANGGFRYELRVQGDGSGTLQVYREGEDAPMQTEHLIASQLGDAAT